MPFNKGNQFGRANKGRKRETPKTIWLLQSLADNGVDLQSLLAQSILKAAKGDRQALDLAHLLQKMLPLVANAPKSDQAQVQIDTLVINRLPLPSHGEGNPPSIADAEVVNIPLQPEGK